MSRPSISPTVRAWRIAGIYAGVAVAWILGSGWLLDLRIADPGQRALFEYGKGLAFVLATAALLWFMVRAALRREQALAEERAETLRRFAHSERAISVGMLAGGLAHEFNNLHAVVGGHLDLALTVDQPVERMRQRLEVARKALDRATGLTRSMLDFVRPGDGGRRSVLIHEVVAETVELLRRGLEADGIDLVPDLVPVPPIQADPHQLGQVVMNLVLNAAHALRGQPVRRIGIVTGHDGATVRILVSDTGPGISPEHRARLFEPFFTTRSGADGADRGTGLGLPVSLAMIEAHGGRLVVDSEPGRGSVFAVELPLPHQDAVAGRNAGP